MKDVGLRIRIQRDLREQFLEVCRAQDKPAAQVLREFMRRYVAKQGAVASDNRFEEKQETGESLRNEDRRERKPFGN